VDVWGKATKLRVELNGNQPVQRIKIGPLPTFIIDVDPMLLAFRMSVAVKEKQLDSFLGQVQKLSVEFVNPISASLVGETRILPPKTWTVDSPTQPWEALADREATQTFDIVLTNTARIGTHELPIQFEIDTDPPNIITVYRDIKVGPEGLDLAVTTKLLPSGDVHITIEFTNRGTRSHSYDCILFPPPGRQYQRQVIPIQPGETVSRVIRWPNGADLIGKRMLLRAVELDGRRALNYAIDVSR
jgi:hypothetical protein